MWWPQGRHWRASILSKDDFYSQLFERTHTESNWAVRTSQDQPSYEAGARGRMSSAIDPNQAWAIQSDAREPRQDSSTNTLSSLFALFANWFAQLVSTWTSARSEQTSGSWGSQNSNRYYGHDSAATKVRSGLGFTLLNSLSPPMIILMGALSLGTTGFYVLRDQMIMSLIQRQNELELTYENRLVGMRSEIDKITSRQMVDQDSVEGRMQAILARQAQLENRASMIAALSDQVGSIPSAANAGTERMGAKSGADKSLNPSSASSKPLYESAPAQDSALGYAPNTPAQAGEKALNTPILKNKPQPEGLELGRPDSNKYETGPRASLTRKPAHQIILDESEPMEAQLDRLSGAIEDLEQRQVAIISKARAQYANVASKLKIAFSEIGLSPDHLIISNKNARAMGGPFIPMKLNPKAGGFEGEMANLQAELIATTTMRQALPFVPLRKPLPVIDLTSTFGYRVDPFIRRMAMHTGIDLRLARGAPVHATAAGKVDSAGHNGGYGNMVDIDHGNGLVTRYGHLASITVKEGQTVKIGDVIGLMGSTGRSTGPHLHYEIRIHDNPVDPLRFLRAGAKVANEL